MSCVENVCGTGGWTGPKPGDPDNSITLAAVPAYGGIDIVITYPTVNPFAVAFINLYRSDTSSIDNAMLVTKFTGTYFFDRIDSTTTYWYWVELVSINGTVMDRIGPASAQAKPTIEQMLLILTGQIDAGLLAQALRSEIGKITPLTENIGQEIQDRLAANEALQQALAAVQNDMGTTMTYVQQEIQQRKDADSALVTSINSIAAGVAGNAAAITTEQTVRAAKDTAMASDITALMATVGDASSGIIHDLTVTTGKADANATAITGLTAKVGDASSGIVKDLSTVTSTANTTASDLSKLSAVVGDNNSGLVQKLNTTTTTANAAANNFTQLSATVGDVNSGLVHDLNAVSTKQGTMSSDITTLQSTVNGNSAQGQIGLTTWVGNLNNAMFDNGNVTGLQTKVGQMGTLYTVKTNVNGLIGGFGTYNDGNTVQMGFDVDSFWVGRTSAAMVKPFIISGGTTYINDAVIASLTFSKLRADDGSVIVANGKLKANYIDADSITAKSVDISTGGAGAPTTRLTNGLFQVNYASGGVCCRMGIW